MKAERKTRKLLLSKTTLRLLSPHQLLAVAGVNGTEAQNTAGQDSLRTCVLETDVSITVGC